MAEMIDIGEQLANGQRINALRQFHNLIRDLRPRALSRRTLSLSKGSLSNPSKGSRRPPTA